LAAGSLRASASISPMVSSATATAFAPGVFITTMPRRVAASASMLSTPTPARPTTRSFGACSISASSTCTALRTTSASASARAAGKPSGNWSCVRTSHPGSAANTASVAGETFSARTIFILSPLSFCRCFILVKADAVLLAQQIEHPHHGRMRLALAPLVLGDRVGMHAQPLRHLVLIEVKLLARDQQLFSKTQFGHETAPC
jgi:hypothetical protein